MDRAQLLRAQALLGADDHLERVAVAVRHSGCPCGGTGHIDAPRPKGGPCLRCNLTAPLRTGEE